MRKFIQNLLAIVLLLGIFSCVDEINLSLEESNQAIVIDAWLGNNPDETYVKIYRTSPYVSGVLNPSFIPVLVKSVVVEQSDGDNILFSQVNGNLFQPQASFTPVEGRSYRLVVETLGGEIFESSWETMPPKVEVIDVVTQAFEKQIVLTVNQTPILQVKTFADVRAQIQDPGIGELGFLVETSGITELYTSSNRDTCICACYEKVTNIFAGMNLVSNEPFQNRNFGLSLGEIPLSSLGRYFVDSKVKVVNKSSYNFLNLVDQQQRNSGSIFDPAPFRIRGNIKKRDSDDGLVLGGFFLFQESTFEKLLFRDQIRGGSLNLNHALDPLPFVLDSCTEFYTNASLFVPPAFRP